MKEIMLKVSDDELMRQANKVRKSTGLDCLSSERLHTPVASEPDRAQIRWAKPRTCRLSI